jgi:hypothetical protein
MKAEQDTAPTPLIVVSTFKVKEGRLEDVKRYYLRTLEFFEANEPRLIAFHGFLNEDGTEMTSIQVHPDTASMEFHIQILMENWDKYFSEYGQLLENTGIEYYGTPPKTALEKDIAIRSDLGLKPIHIAGFTRSTGG